VSDKLPLQSKKFAAFLISEVSWKVIILVCVVKLIQESEQAVSLHSIMLTSVIIAGFIEAGYIGGQAWLDRYVKVAQITTGNGNTAQSIPKKSKGHEE
jgi:hypothetical protein|tara:strand:- start:34 stop:327 length:294 start_codon:yes stop_codon:yes gene_type:complete